MANKKSFPVGFASKRIFEPRPEEDEPTIALCVNFSPLYGETLRDCRFHFRHSASRIQCNVSRYAMAPVHYECSLVHTTLRRPNEIFVMRLPRPTRVDVSVRVEY